MPSAGLRCDVLKRQKSKYFNLSDAKIVRCLFGLSWRLLISLPPPPWFLRGLQKNHPLQLKVNYLQHMILTASLGRTV